jgi:CRP-like cAMP-binding protein
MARINWIGALPLMDQIAALREAGDHLTLIADHAAPPPADLTIFAVDAGMTTDQIAALSDRIIGPWIVWNTGDAALLTIVAYEAGATAVLPGAITPTLLVQAIRHTLVGSDTARPAGATRTRHYRAGDAVLLHADEILEIEAGVLAQVALHRDGKDVLLGLFGPGHLVLGHPDDECALHLTAQSNLTVRVRAWSEASRDPRVIERLATRVRQMEAWAAMQARPYLDQRLLGILNLLAEQFGVAHPHGTLINVRVTHAQLASAIGATRTTVTRLLGDLRTRGLLTNATLTDGERFCLRDQPHGDHTPPRHSAFDRSH